MAKILDLLASLRLRVLAVKKAHRGHRAQRAACSPGQRSRRSTAPSGSRSSRPCHASGRPSMPLGGGSPAPGHMNHTPPGRRFEPGADDDAQQRRLRAFEPEVELPVRGAQASHLDRAGAQPALGYAGAEHQRAVGIALVGEEVERGSDVVRRDPRVRHVAEEARLARLAHRPPRPTGSTPPAAGRAGRSRAARARARAGRGARTPTPSAARRACSRFHARCPSRARSHLAPVALQGRFEQRARHARLDAGRAERSSCSRSDRSRRARPRRAGDRCGAAPPRRAIERPKSRSNSSRWRASSAARAPRRPSTACELRRVAVAGQRPEVVPVRVHRLRRIAFVADRRRHQAEERLAARVAVGAACARTGAASPCSAPRASTCGHSGSSSARSRVWRHNSATA